MRKDGHQLTCLDICLLSFIRNELGDLFLVGSIELRRVDLQLSVHCAGILFRMRDGSGIYQLKSA